MSEYPNVTDELLKAIINEEVNEVIYSAQKEVGAGPTLTDLESDTVSSGYIGVIMGLAVNFDASTTYYIEVAGKQRYENGLTAAGLADIAVGAGVGDEIFLGEVVDEGKEWKLQAVRTAGALDQNYRLRVRYYKKDSSLVVKEEGS